jgi:hypothetical protein
VGVDQKGGKKLLVFEKKVLRTICDPKIGNGVYRRRYNHELDKEFDLCPNALNVTKTNRLRYADYMIKRPEDLPQKAIFRAKPKSVVLKSVVSTLFTAQKQCLGKCRFNT